MIDGQMAYILFSSNLSLLCLSIESTYKLKCPTWSSWVRFMYDAIDGEKQRHRLRYSSFMIRTTRAYAIYSIKFSPSSIVCFKIMIVSAKREMFLFSHYLSRGWEDVVGCIFSFPCRFPIYWILCEYCSITNCYLHSHDYVNNSLLYLCRPYLWCVANVVIIAFHLWNHFGWIVCPTRRENICFYLYYVFLR